MRQLPLPSPSDAQLQDIESTARNYFDACVTLRVVHGGKRASTSDAPELPGLSSTVPDSVGSVDSNHLRELHWCMDAAVLRLYALPPKLERMLLDYFSGYRRERVPFDQTEYIPAHVSELNTLDQCLAVTARWDVHNERRSVLIDREYEGRITKAELSELESLQKLASLRRDLLAPLPLVELEAEVERLKREDKWE